MSSPPSTADTASAETTTTGNFFERLERRVEEANTHLCVGLDPRPIDLFPPEALGGVEDGGKKAIVSEEEMCDAAFTYCKTIIDATADHAAAYKPNAAFFESLGTNMGCSTLRRVIQAVPANIPVLLDVKRGDIGSTAEAYADACYDSREGMDAGAVTLSPLMGYDSVRPFVTGKYADRGAFLLCKTSNPGSNDILTLPVLEKDGEQGGSLNEGRPGEGGDSLLLYEKIASLTPTWSARAAAEDKSSSAISAATTTAQTHSRLGLVVGATDPSALARARKAAGPDVWILAPGVGAQGGDLLEACRAGFNSMGTKMLVPVSRGIGRADDPGEAAKKLKDDINAAISSIVTIGADNDADADGSVNTTIAPYQREFIEFSMDEGVLKFGSFVLKSGRTSPYFFNAGLFATGGSLHRLGRAYAAAIVSSSELSNENGSGVAFDVVFGPAYKGISLGALVCASLYADHGVDVGFAYNRKEAKDHGEGGLLVGASMENKRVLIVDDVITAGTAIRESHTMLRDIGAKPIGVAIALDRAEKRALDDPVSAVQSVMRDLSIPVVSIVSLPQLQMFLSKSNKFAEDVVESVKRYREEYGV